MRPVSVAAVDLGASSGRIIHGSVAQGRIALTEVARFANEPVTAGGTLHWDVLSLHRNILDGLRAAPAVDSIGIDSWGVDYGLLDTDGVLLGNPVHYRDTRTDGVADRLLAGELDAADLYARTGIQVLPFNTVFQLAATRGTAQLAAARTLLMIPDLFVYWLTGDLGSELTNASTTALLDARTGAWDIDLLRTLGLDPGLLTALREPGTVAGPLLPAVAATTGQSTVVTRVGSHDTASAVVAVPAQSGSFAYISCGTWSLVGVETTTPALTPASRAANFTHERGIDGTFRYLRNVMGLWPLQESLRVWQAAGLDVALDDLLAAAAARPAFASLVDIDEPQFLPPGDMPGRIAEACRRAGAPVPADPPGIVRCIVDSLAVGHRRALDDAVRLSGKAVEVVHIVGGGSRNELLCQATADACGLPVVAGPTEATAIGNILVQARSVAGGPPTLDELRALVRASFPTRIYQPAH